MKRFLMVMFTLTVVAPAALLAVVLLYNWGQAIALKPDDPRVFYLLLPGNRLWEAGLTEALAGLFAVGVALGVWASLLSFWGLSRTWGGAIAQLQLDNRRLAAANRALEGALPVLRERYDETIGALDPAGSVYDTPVGADEPLGDDVTEPVDVAQLAIEDAASRAV